MLDGRKHRMTATVNGVRLTYSDIGWGVPLLCLHGGMGVDASALHVPGILDLAKHMLNLSGLKPFVDVDIVFTGIRPGEKLIEELQITEESMNKTRHPKIFIGMIADYPEAKVGQALERLALLSQNGHEVELRSYLSELLPEAQFRDSQMSAVATAAASQGD